MCVWVCELHCVPAPSVHFVLTHLHSSKIFFWGCTTSWALRNVGIGFFLKCERGLKIASVPYSGWCGAAVSPGVLALLLLLLPHIAPPPAWSLLVPVSLPSTPREGWALKPELWAVSGANHLLGGLKLVRFPNLILSIFLLVGESD